jgi:hypothetical protein
MVTKGDHSTTAVRRWRASRGSRAPFSSRCITPTSAGQSEPATLAGEIQTMWSVISIMRMMGLAGGVRASVAVRLLVSRVGQPLIDVVEGVANSALRMPWLTPITRGEKPEGFPKKLWCARGDSSKVARCLSPIAA